MLTFSYHVILAFCLTSEFNSWNRIFLSLKFHIKQYSELSWWVRILKAPRSLQVPTYDSFMTHCCRKMRGCSKSVQSRLKFPMSHISFHLQFITPDSTCSGKSSKVSFTGETLTCFCIANMIWVYCYDFEQWQNGKVENDGGGWIKMEIILVW